MAAPDVADPELDGIAWDLEPAARRRRRGRRGVEALLAEAQRRADAFAVAHAGKVADARRRRPRRRDARAGRANELVGPRGLVRDARLLDRHRRPRARRAAASSCRSARRRSRRSSCSSSSSGRRSTTTRAEELLATPRARLLPPSPAHRAPLPAAPALRARGADPGREGADRSQRLDAPVRGADRGDPGHAARAAASPSRSRSRSRGSSPPTARCAARAPRPSPRALAPGLRVRGYVLNTLLADKMVDDRLRSLPALAREPQPRQRGLRRVGRRR